MKKRFQLSPSRIELKIAARAETMVQAALALEGAARKAAVQQAMASDLRVRLAFLRLLVAQLKSRSKRTCERAAACLQDLGGRAVPFLCTPLIRPGNTAHQARVATVLVQTLTAMTPAERVRYGQDVFGVYFAAGEEVTMILAHAMALLREDLQAMPPG